MQLEELTPAIIRRAVEIYMGLAWPSGSASAPSSPGPSSTGPSSTGPSSTRPSSTAPPRTETARRVLRPMFDLARLEAATTVADLFELCDKARSEDDGPLFARYTLRLGNERYPFMKFVVQEYLVHGEYFFSVDSHDEHIDVRPDHPDYQGFLEIRAHNRALKLAIEAAWERAGLPTHSSLRVLAEGLAEEEREEAELGLVLVVDDEEDVALGVASLLTARGYRTETAFDGRQVLERLQRDPLPDLVLLDYSMPVLDGEEVLDRMRADPRTREVPVLLATASSIDLARMGRVSGLLRKPYPRAVLYALLERLLRPKRKPRRVARG